MTTHNTAPSQHTPDPVDRPSTPVLLSTLWVAILLADALRGIHETLRPGFVRELAEDGTVYGNEVTDASLGVYGVVLGFLCCLVVASRVLPRRPNRWVNGIGAVMMSSGILVTWPKDPDDLIFGALMLAGALAVLVISVRWSDRPAVDSTEIPPGARQYSTSGQNHLRP